MPVRRLAEEQPESFSFTEENGRWAEHTIRKFPEGRQASAVIPLLARVQEQEGWVTKPAIEAVATLLDMPLIRVLEVATFYTMFHLSPVGTKAHVQVCGTTPCMLRGSEALMDVCRRRIAPHQHELSADAAFSWEEVECLGACVNAPMVQIFKDTYEDLDPAKLEAILDAFARGEQPRPGPQVDRISSAPATGLTSLTELRFSEPEEATAPPHETEHVPEYGADVAPDQPHTGRDDYSGGLPLEEQQALARGETTKTPTGTDPATGEAANQKIGRPDPSGRSDEAASRAMHARTPERDAALPEQSPSEKPDPAPLDDGTGKPGTRKERQLKEAD